jgi:hypothetical protein
VNEELDLGEIIFQHGNSLLVDCKLVGLSENAQRSTPNAQFRRPFTATWIGQAATRGAFALFAISGLDVQRWTLDVGRLLLLRHEIQI